MIVAIDFDGTLVQHDKALEGAKDAVNLLREKGHKIVIYSCNNRDWIKRVLDNNSIRYDWIYGKLEFMKEGKPVADLYIDDRGYRFNGNWAEEIKDILVLLES